MKREVIVCDNPDCESITYDRYGWLVGELTIVGSGPKVTVEVCSSECLEGGVDFRIEDHHSRERESWESRHHKILLAALEIPCTTCEVAAGESCVTKTNRPAPEPHAPRLKSARDTVRNSPDV